MPRPAFDLVVFDLDGTLAETRHGICDSVAHVLGAFGRPALPLQTVVAAVGDGARKLIERCLGADSTSDDVERGLGLFVEHYLQHCLQGSQLYDGVDATLRQLASLGTEMAVLTNKPEAPSETILAGRGIRGLFRQVIGGDSAQHPRKPAPAGLFSLVERWGSDPGRTLLVGDTAVDVLTGRNAGIAVAGALWGFRPHDFVDHPPDWQLERFGELPGLVESG